MLTYRVLSAAQISPDLFAQFQRRQEVTKCWRKTDGIWTIRDIAFIDEWSPREFKELLAHLRAQCRAGGLVFAAFSDGAMKGFVCVDAGLFGSRRQYMDLSHIYVSQDMRKKGIGRRLFEQAKAYAKAHDAQKLYISAHSAVESQAFYRALGCVEAAEYSLSHVEKEPCDCQLEYRL